MTKIPKEFTPGFHQTENPTIPVVIDRNSRFAKNLLAAYLLPMHQNLVNGELAENYNNGATSVGYGYDFDGSNDILKINSEQVNLKNLSGLTILIRLKANSLSDRRVVCFGGTGATFFGIGSTNSSPYTKLRVYTTIRFEGTTYTFDSNGDVFDNEWHTVVLTFANRECKIYIDGKLDTTNVGGASPGANDDTPYNSIGAAIRGSSPNGFSFSDGIISKVLIFDEVFTEAKAIDISRFSNDVFKPANETTFFTTTAAGGAFTLTADTGSYTYSGTAADVLKGSNLSADSGTYAYSGTAVDLNQGFLLSADSGTYTYSGTAADVLKGSNLSADSGTYTYSGTAATLTFTPAGVFTLSADSGTYTYSGTAAEVLKGSNLSADSGTYTYSGTAVGLNQGFTLSADSGTYTYSGTAVDFSSNKVLAANSGTYTYSGTTATLRYVTAAGPATLTAGVTSIISTTAGAASAITTTKGITSGI